jgi:hypothetical protein
MESVAGFAGGIFRPARRDCLVASRNDSSCRFSRFRVGLKRIVVNALCNEKLASWFSYVGGFVNVGWHINSFFSRSCRRDWRQTTESDLRGVLRSGDTRLLQQNGRQLYRKSMFANNWTDSIRKLGILHDFVKLICVHRG